jgi:glycosyltransferase involved in cell wall biosynthesis
MDIATEQPLVTTVIPTYRRPLWLRRAILSALQQSYPHILVLVCDNASGDETEEVVRRLAEKDPRVRYYRHATNAGSYNNFNYGIRNVTTPFFSLLSDDDVLLPDFYHQSLHALKQFPEAMFACMATMVMDPDGNVVSKPVLAEKTRLIDAAEGLTGPRLRPIPAAWTAILFRTHVRDTIGMIDADAGPFADGSYVMHAAARFPFVDVPGMGATLIAHQASTSGTMKPVDGEWLYWWENMIRRIEVDQAVPDRARVRLRTKEVMDILAFDLGKIAIQQVMKSLSAGNLVYAGRAAVGAKECGYPLISRILTVIVQAERWTHLVRPALWIVRAIRRALHCRERSYLNRRFAHERAEIMRLQNMACCDEQVTATEDKLLIKSFALNKSRQ